MKKTVVVLGSVCALLVSSCANILTPTPPVGPTVDSAATADAQFRTAVAQTLTAQPTSSPTTVPDTPTPVLPVASPTLPPTEVLPATVTGVVNATTAAPTGTFSAATATGGPLPTATLVPGQVTAIWTLAIREYGTLPPAVPFSRITLVNRAKAEAYISLQVTMPDGNYSILEYPVEGSVEIKAPVGSYLYVTWVGGRKMVGTFRLRHDEDLTITLYRDRVEIK